jgi:peptidoglycan-associated lipoprotein
MSEKFPAVVLNRHGRGEKQLPFNIESIMKRSSLISAVVVGLAVIVISTGCKTHRPLTTTEIPAVEPSPAPPPNNNVNAGGQVPPPDHPASAEGIPISENSKWTKIWTGPHDEDRDKFKADTVYFDFDSSVIRPAEQPKLQDVAAFFKSDSTDALQVEGNCDERGTEKYNLSLGERRALAVREYLANLGMDPQRIHTITYGASRPADPGHNEDAWKKNRRGELVLLIPK